MRESPPLRATDESTSEPPESITAASWLRSSCTGSLNVSSTTEGATSSFAPAVGLEATR